MYRLRRVAGVSSAGQWRTMIVPRNEHAVSSRNAFPWKIVIVNDRSNATVTSSDDATATLEIVPQQTDKLPSSSDDVSSSTDVLGTPTDTVDPCPASAINSPSADALDPRPVHVPDSPPADVLDSSTDAVDPAPADVDPPSAEIVKQLLINAVGPSSTDVLSVPADAVATPSYPEVDNPSAALDTASGGPSRDKKQCSGYDKTKTPTMPKKNMIAKICPTCKQQVPVACKSCPCGHFFYNARRIAREFAIEADYRRRTARVRREKPNYYDALEYDKHIKKMKKRISECENEDEEDNKKENGKDKKKKKVKKEEEEDEEVKFTPEMQAQCQLVLEQINLKLRMVTWKPT